MSKKITLWIAASVAVLVLVFFVFRPHHVPKVEAAQGPPAAEVATVQSGSISQVLTLAGQFQPYQVVKIHPKVSGYIQHIYVDIGDIVHRGETLAVLQVPELQAQLQGTVFSISQTKDDIVRAENEVQRTESRHAALHDEYERLVRASKAQPGLIAQQELDDAQAKDLSSGAQVDAAKSALAAAQQAAQVARSNYMRVKALHQYTDVVAPFSGVVTWRYADTGALIQAGTNSDTQSLPIVTLSQSDVLRLRVPVPEMDVRYVHIGEPMQVTVGAIGQSFVGKVVRFTRDVSLATRTMETEIDVENPALTIDPGMYANTQLQLAQLNNVPTIPVGALVLHGNKDEVEVLDSSNRVHMRTVQVGLQGSLIAQITQGLKPGDRVIIAAQSKYQSGEVVTPVMQHEPASEVYRKTGGEIDMSTQQGANS
jgi:RND family efflux transporter MFP subunit